MNESGASIQAAAAFFKLPSARVLVVHDDVDLETGRLQARLGGGLAGHNGLRSIAQRLGSQDFLRLRVGIGRPGRGDPRPVADYVLSAFAPEDDADALVERASDAVEALAARGARGDAAPLQLRRRDGVRSPSLASVFATAGSHAWLGVTISAHRRRQRVTASPIA